MYAGPSQISSGSCYSWPDTGNSISDDAPSHEIRCRGSTSTRHLRHSERDTAQIMACAEPLHGLKCSAAVKLSRTAGVHQALLAVDPRNTAPG